MECNYFAFVCCEECDNYDKSVHLKGVLLNTWKRRGGEHGIHMPYDMHVHVHACIHVPSDILVIVWFVWSTFGHAQILCLIIRKLCQMSVKRGKMQTCHILVCNNTSRDLSACDSDDPLPIFFGSR